MQKYIGKIVQLIYIDSKRQVSIRNVKVLVAGSEKFMAYCYQAKEVRSFKIRGIVDIELVNDRVLEVLGHVRRHKQKSVKNTI